MRITVLNYSQRGFLRSLLWRSCLMVVDKSPLYISYRVICDCSTIRNLLAFGLLFLFDVMIEFGPMRLSVIRSSMSM